MASAHPLWAIGLMSGTSADGVDGALIHTDGKEIFAFGPTHYVPYPLDVKQLILNAYGQRPQDTLPELSKAIVAYHALCVSELLKQTSEKVDLIGFHGQAVFHAPPETYQIGEGSRLAHLTGLPVVEQLRLNDLAHGGQGAPLAPIFHQALAKALPKPVGLLNIGGISNITWIGEQGEDLLAFDIGPGNGLIDDWMREHTSLAWDEGGKLAAQGSVHSSLLQKWQAHPFLTLSPPKSLDRKAFQPCLEDLKDLPLEDAIATLTAFTALAFEKSLSLLPQSPALWIVSGGGAHNPILLRMIQDKTTGVVKKAADFGWDGDAIEAQAWGFLAVRSYYGLPLSFPGTTGVHAPVSGGRLCVPKLPSEAQGI